MKITLAAVIGVLLALSNSKFSKAQSNTTLSKWGDWSDWSDCPVTCGGGIRIKERRCTMPDVLKERCLRFRRRGCGKKPCPTPDIKPFPVGIIMGSPDPEEMPRAMSPVPESTSDTDSTPEDMPHPKPVTQDSKAFPVGIIVGTPYPEEMPRAMSPVPESTSDTKSTPEDMPHTTPTPEDSKPYPLDIILGKSEQGRLSYDMPPVPESISETKPIPEGTRVTKATPEVTFATKPEPEGIADPRPLPEEMLDRKDAKHEFLPWSDWTPCTVSCGEGKRYRVRECRALSGYPDCEDYMEEWCSMQKCSEKEMPEKSICWKVMQLLMTLLEKERS